MDPVYIIIRNSIAPDNNTICEEHRDITTYFLATCTIIANNIDQKYKIEYYIDMIPMESEGTVNLLNKLLLKFQNNIVPKICKSLRSYKKLRLEADLLGIESRCKNYNDTVFIVLYEMLTRASQLDQIDIKLKNKVDKNLLNIVENYISPDEITDFITIPDHNENTRSYDINIKEMGYTKEKEITVSELKETFKMSEYLNYLLKYQKRNNLLDEDIVFITKSCPLLSKIVIFRNKEVKYR